MPRFADWRRRRVGEGADDAAVGQQGLKLLGELMEDLRRGGLFQGVRRRELPDGTLLTAKFDGTTPVLQVDPPGNAEPTFTIDLHNLWVPRGFLVTPGYSFATGGVGMPVVPQGGDTDPFSPANLTPGLDTARWTPGGPLGEVLLSADRDAGYGKLRAEIAPLLYHDRKGPTFVWAGNHGSFDARPATGTGWAAFRLEFADFTSYFDDEGKAHKRVLFNAINTHRAGASLPPLMLWPRGYYRPAQVFANIEATVGSLGPTSTQYPPTYQSIADRVSKDGYPLEVELAAGASYARGVVPGADELAATGTDTGVLDAWLLDANAKAAIERDVGRAGFLDIGRRGSRYVATIEERSHWIDAGNGRWTPSDPALPVLTWHAPTTLNLAFETYPVGFGADPTPLVKRWDFTAADGACWLRYYRTADASTPALGRHVFARGRALALAPLGALVWAVGAIRLATVDRLVLLAHHPEDQPSDYKQGMARYVRVWYADVPRTRDLALNPDRVICGTDATDPYGWRGGVLIDLGIMPPPAGETTPPDTVNSLKYASCWRFSPDGRRAICLRDYGTYANWSTVLANAQSAAVTDLIYGTYPRAAELVLAENIDGTLTASLQWRPFTAAYATAGRSATSLPGVVTPASGATITENPVIPCAVDYDAAGAVVYAWRVDCSVVTAGGFTVFTYLGTGGEATTWPSELGNRVLAGADTRTVECNFRYNGYLHVLDVRDGVFAAEGTKPRLWNDYATGTYTNNPDYTACITFTPTLVHGAKLWRAGTLLREDWWPCADGVVFQRYDLCDSSTTGSPTHFVVEPVAAFGATLQGYYAPKGADWVASYQISPQPQLAVVRDNDNPDVGVKDCTCQTSFDDYTLRTHLLAAAELAPRGGGYTPSFAMPAGLENAWLIDAKVL